MTSFIFNQQTLVFLLSLASIVKFSCAASARPSPSLTAAPSVFFDAPIDFGAAASFVALAGSTVTSSGSSGTILTGDVGVYPGNAMEGFPPAVVYGSTNKGNTIAQAAANAFTAAYGTASAKPVTGILTSTDLGGLVLIPGVYNFASSAGLNGMLTLDARGDPDAVWTFQVYSYLSVGPGSSVIFKDDIGNVDHIYWQVGSYATIQDQVPMKGNILAFYAVTLNTGASIVGRVVSLNAAVTFDINEVSLPTLTPGFNPTASPTSRPTTQNSPLLTFNCSITLSNVGTPTVSSNGHMAVTNATATSMGITDAAVKYMNDHSTTARRALRERARKTGKPLDLGLLAGYELLATTNTSLTLSSTSYGDVDEMYTGLTDKLKEAITSGAFSAVLQRNAILFDAPELNYAEGTGVIVNDPVTVDASPDSDSDELSAGAIAGIVIGAVAFVLLLAALIFFCFCRTSSGVGA